MIDIELIRKNLDIVKRNLQIRNYDVSLADKAYELDKKWKNLKAELDNKRSEQNRLSKEIAKNKSLIDSVKQLSKDIEEMEKLEKMLKKERDEILSILPNILHESVPIGKDDSDNVEIKKWGDPKPGIAHYNVKGFRFDYGAKLSGHRFTVLEGNIAKLERALINYMVDLAISNGYKEIACPNLVKPEIMYGTGQLPKFEQELYRIERDDLYLIPTAEVPLTNMHKDEILEDLPLNYVSWTPCYRREAGAYGKDIKGYFRQHQFYKVELVKITYPEDSWKHHEMMLRDVEKVLQGLEIPYRVMVLSSGDTGFSSAKTYDLEVWLPSQNKYREISSISNCTDFQARRIPLKFRRDGKLEYPHTLNGSGVAVGRALIALIENHYQDNGIVIPKSLREYVKTDFIPLQLL